MGGFKMDGIKPGIFTTEFLGKTAIQLVLLYNSLYHKNVDPQTAVLIITGLEGIYVAGRSIVKAAADLALQSQAPK